MNKFHVELRFTSDATIEQVRFLYEEHEFEVLEETLALSAREVCKEGRSASVSIERKPVHDTVVRGQRIRDILNDPDLALSDRDKLEVLRDFVSAYEPWIALFEQFVQGYFTKEEGPKPS